MLGFVKVDFSLISNILGFCLKVCDNSYSKPISCLSNRNCVLCGERLILFALEEELEVSGDQRSFRHVKAVFAQESLTNPDSLLRVSLEKLYLNTQQLKSKRGKQPFCLFGLLVIYNNVRFLLVRMLTCFPNTNLFRESTMFMFHSKRFPSQGLGGRVFDPCSTEKISSFIGEL